MRATWMDLESATYINPQADIIITDVFFDIFPL